MNKKIAFVVVALVALVATFCVSFAGMPLADVDVPIIGSQFGDLYIPRSWLNGTVSVDLTAGKPYAESLYRSGLILEFSSSSGALQLQRFDSSQGWVTTVNLTSVWVFAETPVFTCIMIFIDDPLEIATSGRYRFVLPDDVVFKVYEDDVDVTSEYLLSGVVPIFGYFMTIDVPSPPSLGETVINNIIDTLWGTVVSVGDSFGEGMNQMVGDLFFDLDTGDLSAFSIVIICFFALCLLVTIVNWLFFRLTNIKKF